MLRFEQLSYWERTQYIQDNTFVIIGAGLVGMSTALSLKERFPKEKILIIERGYLPTGASTKNAGFACFGSPTELKDDLENITEKSVWETVALRLSGLEQLKKRVSPAQMDYQPCGSWDLISTNEQALSPDFIAHLNENFKVKFGMNGVYQQDYNACQKFGFQGFKTSYFNAFEGSIDTGKLIHTLQQKCTMAGIQFLFATEVKEWKALSSAVEIETQHGFLQTQHLFICTNGFSQRYFSDELRPARAQVLITEPLEHAINGTFHCERGYYYFRNIGNRILLGGGRNLDFETETSTAFESNQRIQRALIDKLKNEILPGKIVEIAYSWSGIMCVGDQKKPLIRSLNKNVHAGVRMGGMGIAIGTAVGDSLSKLV